MPNAVVSVVNEDTKLSRSATSNQSGNYVIADLPIGFYDVSAVAQGFKKFVLTKINVSVGQQAT